MLRLNNHHPTFLTWTNINVKTKFCMQQLVCQLDNFKTMTMIIKLCYKMFGRNEFESHDSTIWKSRQH